MLRGTGFSRVRKGRGVSTRADVTCHRTPPESLAIISRPAKSVRKLNSMSRGRLDLCDPLLEGLPQDLQDIAAGLRQFIQQEASMVRQRHVARHRDLPPTDQPRIRDRMGGAKWARHAEGSAITSEAGNTVDANGLEGFPLAPPSER
jgi:hypothetical protein